MIVELQQLLLLDVTREGGVEEERDQYEQSVENCTSCDEPDYGRNVTAGQNGVLPLEVGTHAVSNRYHGPRHVFLRATSVLVLPRTHESGVLELDEEVRERKEEAGLSGWEKFPHCQHMRRREESRESDQNVEERNAVCVVDTIVRGMSDEGDHQNSSNGFELRNLHIPFLKASATEVSMFPIDSII